MKSYLIQRSGKYTISTEWRVSKQVLVARDVAVTNRLIILLIQMSFSDSFLVAPQYSTLWTK